MREIDSDFQIQKTLFGRLATVDESKQRLERWLGLWEKQGIGFWLFSNADGILVGHAGLFPSPQNADAIEIGYTVKPAFWGRGYATEMARAVVDVAFADLTLDAVVANAMPENNASRRVLQRIGFSLVGETLYRDEFPSVEYRMERVDWHARHVAVETDS